MHRIAAAVAGLSLALVGASASHADITYTVNTDGTGSWVDGNLGAAAPTPLAERTYRALGWTIVANASELRFTNDATGHGAVVSAARVAPF